MSVVARAVLFPLLALLCATLGSACAPHYAHVVERPLQSTGGLKCPGYLVWNQEPVRDVFLVVNGSGTLCNAFVQPTFKAVIDTGRVAYLTYDKVGIRAPFGDPAAVRRDYALFEQYTFHYYRGGHEGSEAARAELTRLLTEAVTAGTRR